MSRRLQCLLALVLCAGLAALGFTSAQAQERNERTPIQTMTAPPGALKASRTQQSVLYDQTADDTTFSVGTQEFAPGPFAVYNTQAADDFTVPAGGWDIEAIEVLGTAQDYFEHPVPTPPYNVDVIIYNTCSDGMPCDNGTAVDTAYVAHNVTPDVSTDGNASFAINLSATASLGQGTYWLSVVIDEDFHTYGQWFWRAQASVNGSQASFKTPNSSDPDACLDWSALSDCLSSSPLDLSFALYDAPFPPPPPALALSPDSLGITAAVGDSSTDTVTISNERGTQDLTVSDLEITGVDAGAFSISGTPAPPFTLSGGSSETVEITFSSTTASVEQASLEITGDDGGTPGTVATVPLSGQSFAPVMSLDEDFDDVTPPALPEGWTIANANDDVFVWETVTGEANSSPNEASIRFNYSLATDDWLFTRPLDLAGGTTYRLAFAYRAGAGSYAENLEVKFGSGAAPDSMTNPPLFSETDFTNTEYEEVTTTFTPPSDGIYYVGFHGFSDPGQFSILFDDVVVEEQPSTPSFVVTPDTVDFGTVLTPNLSASSAHVEVQNDGGGTLTVQEPTITGMDASAFVVEDDTSSYPAGLSAGGALGFDVGLSSDLSAGTYSATLEIPYDDGSGGTQTATVPLSVTVASPNFGGPIAGYYYANNTEAAQGTPGFQAPGVVPLDLSLDNQNSVTIGDEEAVGPFDIGFDFVYFGQSYDQFCIGSNGWIHLLNASGTCPNTAFGNDPIPSAGEPNGIIAFFWDDLNGSEVPSTEVLYGTDDDGNLLVSFEDYGEYSGGPDAFFSADVKLYQSADASTNGNIRVQYNGFSTGADTASATVGLENADGTAGVQYRYGDLYGNSEGGPLQAAGDTLALVFGPDQSALPVELAGFAGATREESVTLSWKTLSEHDNQGFQVQMKRHLKAADGSSQHNEWQDVGFVESKAAGGTSTEAQTYHLRVENLDVGAYTFRLKQVDLDGTRTVSEQTVEVKIGVEGTYELSGAYPNPFQDRATFEVAVKETQQVTVEVYDVLGRRVMQVYDGELEGGQAQTITVEARGLASGVYFYRVSGEGFTASKKMMIVR